VPGWLVFRDGCPDGEVPAQVGERVDRVIARLRGGEGPSLVFAHGHLLRVLLARWIDLPPSEGRRFLLDTATLNVLSHYGGAPALRCWNAPLA
jgi:probable phosphoglycerate mutase